MKRRLALSLTLALVLITAHRLPAPIQEVPESPAPTVAAAAKPKPKSKDSELKRKPGAKSSPSPAAQGPAPFTGTWRGTLPFGTFGDLHLTLVVNKEGTLITETGGVVDGSHPGAPIGNVVTWRSGAFNAINWTLTPNADGKTASVAVRGGLFIGDYSAIFQKVSR